MLVRHRARWVENATRAHYGGEPSLSFVHIVRSPSRQGDDPQTERSQQCECQWSVQLGEAEKRKGPGSCHRAVFSTAGWRSPAGLGPSVEVRVPIVVRVSPRPILIAHGLIPP